MIFVPDTIIGIVPGSRFTAFASIDPNYNELLESGILPNELLAHFIRYEPFPCSIGGVLGLYPDVSVYQCDSEVLETEAWIDELRILWDQSAQAKSVSLKDEHIAAHFGALNQADLELALMHRFGTTVTKDLRTKTFQAVAAAVAAAEMLVFADLDAQQQTGSDLLGQARRGKNAHLKLAALPPASLAS